FKTRYAIASGLNPGPEIVVMAVGWNIREQQFRHSFRQIHLLITSSRAEKARQIPIISYLSLDTRTSPRTDCRPGTTFSASSARFLRSFPERTDSRQARAIRTRENPSRSRTKKFDRHSRSERHCARQRVPPI